MRSLTAVLCVVMMYAVVSSANLTKTGTLSSDETWDTDGDTVFLTGDVRVRNGVTLVIEAGTVVRGVQSNLTDLTPRHIYTSADGAIQVNGTPSNQVIFKTVRLEWDGLTRDADNWVKGAELTSGWGHGLCEFRNESGSAEVSHVLFEDLDMPSTGSCGFYITSGGSPTIRRSSFGNGRSGLWAHGGGQMVVENCVFYNQTATGVIPGGLSAVKQAWEPMSCYIDHCVFYNVDGSSSISGVPVATGYAVCTVNYPGTLEVTNSIFQDIQKSSVRDWNIEDPNFSENWVVRSDYNVHYRVGEEPIRLLSTGSNSIVDQDPLMADPDNADVSLGSGSPALDAASDGTNIGAWQGSSIDLTPNPLNGLDLGAVNNPFRNSVAFNFQSYDGAYLSIYNSQGQLVNRLRVNADRVDWDGTDFTGKVVVPGMYYYNLNADNYSTLQTLIKVK